MLHGQTYVLKERDVRIKEMLNGAKKMYKDIYTCDVLPRIIDEMSSQGYKSNSTNHAMLHLPYIDEIWVSDAKPSGHGISVWAKVQCAYAYQRPQYRYTPKRVRL